MAAGIVASPFGQPPEGFDQPGRGDVTWVTLFSADRTPTSELCGGVMTLPPGGGHLAPHRHAPAEIYFVVAGSGRLTVDGTESRITAGQAAFIPGDALHALVNDGSDELRVFYVFPTGSFADIVYRFETE